MAANILLVDDEVSVLLTLKAVLELRGHAVATAESLVEAKELLTSNTFDLVVTDLVFGTRVDGLLVIGAANSIQRNTPVVILSAFPEMAGDWRSMGASLILRKPMHTRTLCAHLESFIVPHEEPGKEQPVEKVAPPAQISEFFLPLERLTTNGRIALAVLLFFAILLLVRVPVVTHFRGYSSGQDIWLWEDSPGAIQFGKVLLRETFLLITSAVAVLFFPKRFLLRQ